MSYTTELIIHNGKGDLLVRRGAQRGELPTVEVDEGRIGVNVSRAVRQQLGMRVFFQVPTGAGRDEASRAMSAGDYQILRLQNDEAAGRDFTWTRFSEWLGVGRGESIAAAMSGEENGTGSFAWYSEVQEWLREQTAKLGVSLVEIEQWNGRVGGVLLRVRTSGPTLWLKTCDDLNEREYLLTQALANRSPDRFPRIVAVHNGWRGLLLQHVNGTELHGSDDPNDWTTTAKTLAQLQLLWVNHDDLLRMGARDLRASTLLRLLPRYIENLVARMERQQSLLVRKLSRPEIDALNRHLQQVCEEVAALPFAVGLANGDFSAHNTLLTANGPVFIDWAEACVSLPLIAGEFFSRRMVVETPSRADRADALMNAYMEPWKFAYGEAVVFRALRVLSVFSMLAASMFYEDTTFVTTGSQDAHVRSLARRMCLELGIRG